MDPALRHLIEALHRAPIQYVLSLTGGGATTAGLLLSVPGGSRTVLEVIVPYHEMALAEFLGHAPEQYCSPTTARAMAQRAFERAAWLAPRAAVAGVGCTASLASDRPKRGDHRFFLAIHTAANSVVHSLTLAKDARDRLAEEHVLSLVLLNAMAESFGIAERVPVPLLPGESVQVDTATDSLAALLNGTVPALCAEPDGRLHTDGARQGALLPGSFNPLHEAHLRLAEVAAARSGLPVAFELSVTNVDKPTLAAEEVRHRLRQRFGRPVWLTRAPTFLEKAALFPGVLFVVGADTADRIVEARYYGDSEERLHGALQRLRTLGCRFLVAGRVDGEGKHVSCDDLAIAAPHRDLFTALPESEFRVDVSSTRLRGQA